jgi:hypothetical protein
MTHCLQKNFGFIYEHKGRECAFSIVATSSQEAQDRHAAMKSASLVGEMVDASQRDEQAANIADGDADAIPVVMELGA